MVKGSVFSSGWCLDMVSSGLLSISLIIRNDLAIFKLEVPSLSAASLHSRLILLRVLSLLLGFSVEHFLVILAVSLLATRILVLARKRSITVLALVNLSWMMVWLNVFWDSIDSFLFFGN